MTTKLKFKLFVIPVLDHFELLVIPVLTEQDFDTLFLVPIFDLVNYMFFQSCIIGYSSKIIIGYSGSPSSGQIHDLE